MDSGIFFGWCLINSLLIGVLIAKVRTLSENIRLLQINIEGLVEVAKTMAETLQLQRKINEQLSERKLHNVNN